MGVEDGTIPESQLIASSSKPGECDDKSKWRLNAVGGKWCPDPASGLTDEWVGVQFTDLTRVSGVSTQGDPQAANWITKYTIQYQTVENGPWETISGMFNGNTDGTSIVKNNFASEIQVLAIRIMKVADHNDPALRFEFFRDCGN